MKKLVVKLVSLELNKAKTGQLNLRLNFADFKAKALFNRVFMLSREDFDLRSLRIWLSELAKQVNEEVKFKSHSELEFMIQVEGKSKEDIYKKEQESLIKKLKEFVNKHKASGTEFVIYESENTWQDKITGETRSRLNYSPIVPKEVQAEKEQVEVPKIAVKKVK